MDISQNAVSFLSPDSYSDLVDYNIQNGENIYIVANQYITQMSKRVVKYDDSKAVGEFYALDLDTWLEIDNHIIDENRLGVGTDYSLKDVRVYIQIGIEGRTENCENKYLLFYRNDWIELRRSRGPEKYQPGTVDEYGVIWTGKNYQKCKFRTFVKREQ